MIHLLILADGLLVLPIVIYTTTARTVHRYA